MYHWKHENKKIKLFGDWKRRKETAIACKVNAFIRPSMRLYIRLKVGVRPCRGTCELIRFKKKIIINHNPLCVYTYYVHVYAPMMSLYVYSYTLPKIRTKTRKPSTKVYYERTIYIRAYSIWAEEKLQRIRGCAGDACVRSVRGDRGYERGWESRHMNINMCMCVCTTYTVQVRHYNVVHVV